MEHGRTAQMDHPHPHEHEHDHAHADQHHDHAHAHGHAHPHPLPYGQSAGEMADALVRSPHLALTWSGERLMLTDGLTGNLFAVSPEIVGVLDGAGRPVRPADLAERAAVEPSLVDALAGAGILVPAHGAAPPAGWSTHELIVQRMAGGGAARHGLDLAGMPPMRKGSWSATVIELPEPAAPGGTLAGALAGRRSRRVFDPGLIRLSELASVLVGAAGVQRADPADGVSYRPHASGGGRHPLEITVLAQRVDGLERGVYSFDAFDRTLHDRDVDLAMVDEVAAEVGGSLGLDHPCDAPAILLVTAVFARTLWKYDAIGLGLVYRDTGCLLQTLHLVTTGLGLAGSPAMVRRELDVSRWLGLDPNEESLVGCFVLGRPEG